MLGSQPIALVTGASSGFGQQIAQRLVRKGFRTFGTSRSAQPNLDGVEMLELDVRSDDSVAACLQAIKSCAGDIDVLVNNAGVLVVGPAEELAIEQAEAIFETNFFGVVRMTHAVLPSMRDRGSGKIINISSLAGLLAPPGEAFYAASKFALEGYTEALSHEIAPFGIAASLIEPGFFRTNINKQSAAQSSYRIRAYDRYRKANYTSIEQSINTGGNPALVARLVAEIARSKRVRLRYRIGRDARWFPRLRLLLPDWLYAWGLRRRFGIK